MKLKLYPAAMTHLEGEFGELKRHGDRVKNA